MLLFKLANIPSFMATIPELDNPGLLRKKKNNHNNMLTLDDDAKRLLVCEAVFLNISRPSITHIVVNDFKKFWLLAST